MKRRILSLFMLIMLSPLGLACDACKTSPPVVAPPAQTEPPPAPVSVESATRRQIALKLDQGQLAVESLRTIKIDLRKQNVINHDQELAITNGLAEANGVILEALRFMRDNPVFDVSSTGKIAGLVKRLSATVAKIANGRFPQVVANGIRQLGEIADTAQKIFN